MTKRRSTAGVFNLSFLDIMFCGFGAVVLLVLVIHSRIKTDNEVFVKDLTAEIKNFEKQLQAASIYKKTQHELLQKKIETVKQNDIEFLSLTNQYQSQKKINEDLSSQVLDEQNTVDKLKQALQEQEKSTQLALDKKIEPVTRDKILEFQGDGQRQYLSGLKLGGKHILIFVDVSASMLDTTIVNIIRRKNMDDASKRKSKKWQRTLKTVRWLIANLPVDANLQIIAFNIAAEPLTGSGKLTWIQLRETNTINKMLNKLQARIPSKGTSIENAFRFIKKMQPLPDNVFLLTDGLPTQGGKPVSKGKISGAERVELLHQAIKLLPNDLPINTILFPIEGDPMAAALYWKLAVDSGGSFLTPGSDWP